MTSPRLPPPRRLPPRPGSYPPRVQARTTRIPCPGSLAAPPNRATQPATRSGPYPSAPAPAGWRTEPSVAPQVEGEDALGFSYGRRPGIEPQFALWRHLVPAPVGTSARDFPVGLEQALLLQAPEGAVEAAVIPLRPKGSQAVKKLVAVRGRLPQQKEQARSDEIPRLAPIPTIPPLVPSAEPGRILGHAMCSTHILTGPLPNERTWVSGYESTQLRPTERSVRVLRAAGKRSAGARRSAPWPRPFRTG